VRFSGECEAYSDVCSLTPRLCPRLVPSPLWGVNLAKLVRLGAGEAEVLEPGSTSVVAELRRYWWSIDRRACSVCGERGRHVDEEWEYYVVASEELACSLVGDSGVAYLARVNKVDEATARVALRRAMDAWEALSRIESWTIVVGDIGLKEELRTKVEKLLNKLLEKTKQERNPAPYTSNKKLG